MVKNILLLSILIISFFNARAQSWQWGSSGGGNVANTSLLPDNTVIDMATDPAGNVYVLSAVYQTGVNVDGHGITSWGDQDILISSFKCDGTYRWSKDIGSSSTDNPVALKTDSLGGVYVTGALYCDGVTDYIGADSTWAGTSFKSIFLVKFDTAGNYKWFRMPEPDSITIFGIIANSSYVYDISANRSGNIYMLCGLAPGAYASGGFVASTAGWYILEYDNAGNFINGNPIQITGNAGLLMTRDNQLGRYYVTGESNGVSLGTTAITSSQFMGCFNNSGTLLWLRQGTDAIADGSFFGRPTIDAQHNIYIAGSATSTDTFNAYAMINGGSSGSPVVFKLDTNGTNIWAKNAYANGVTNCSPIILNGNEVDISGSYPGKLTWPGAPDSLNQEASAGYAIFITRFNATTGAVLGMDSLKSNFGNDNYATAITADNFGNFYVGGDFASSLYIPVAGDTLENIGGNTNFFGAKYGTSNCDTTLVALGTTSQPTTPKEPLRVYPNPTMDELNIQNAGIGTIIGIFNIVGQQVFTGTITSDNQVVNTAGLRPGTYLLLLTDAGGNRTNKTFIKH